MAKRREAQEKAVRASHRKGRHSGGEATVLKRDEPERCLERIRKARAEYVDIRTVVNFWKPNDRILKPLTAELDALEKYIREVARALDRAIKSTFVN